MGETFIRRLLALSDQYYFFIASEKQLLGIKEFQEAVQSFLLDFYDRSTSAFNRWKNIRIREFKWSFSRS